MLNKAPKSPIKKIINALATATVGTAITVGLGTEDTFAQTKVANQEIESSHLAPKSPSELNKLKSIALAELFQPIKDFSKFIHKVEDRHNQEGLPNHEIDGKDLYYLVWNLFHEARGEDQNGKLASILTVLDRYLSADFPGSIDEVILLSKQYSWVFEGSFPSITAELGIPPSAGARTSPEKFSENDKKQLFDCYIFVMELVAVENRNLTISELRQKIASILSKNLRIEMPKSLTYYKVKNFVSKNPKINKMFDDLEIAMRINVKTPLIIDHHIFYEDLTKSKKYLEYISNTKNK